MEDTRDFGNNDSNENSYLGDAHVTESPESLHFGDSSCVNGTTDSSTFYPDPDDDDDSEDSCVIPQDDTRTSTTSNSFVNDNDDVFETNTTNRSNDSFVNDVTGSNNMYNLDEATYGDTEI